MTNNPATGYTFAGYTVTTTSNDIISVTNGEFVMPANNVTVYGGFYKQEYAYTGVEEDVIVPITGYYKLEVWGAQGGKSSKYAGGYGGYSVGIIELTKGEHLYINVGGKGVNTSYSTGVAAAGGYNGGGSTIAPNTWGQDSIGSGGGATHIAGNSGLLYKLSSKINIIYIVAGGGGGSTFYYDTSAYSYYGAGGHGGGYKGCTNYGAASSGTVATATPGAQTSEESGSLFGLGKTGRGVIQAGGGGGYYGGGTTTNNGAAGGSGYIGNTLLLSSSSLTKHMSCYNCTTSTVSDIYTKKVASVSATATSDYSKTGDGYAKIIYIGQTLN